MKKITLSLIFTTNLIFSQVPNFVPSNGLVGWWPFSGNANDVSGNGNNGIINGPTLTTDRFGVTDKAYNFITASDNISVNNATPPFNNTQISVSLWIKFPLQYNYSTISLLKNGVTYTNGFNLTIDQNDSVYGTNNYLVSFIVGSGTIVSFTSNQTELGNWVNIVSSYDGSNIKIYLNGILKATQIFNQSMNISNNNIIIGIWDNQSLPVIKNRQIDDIGIWNRALTQTEITALYTGVLSSETFSNTTNFQLYPNPANDVVQFKSSEMIEKISIYNTLGQLVQENKTNSLEGAISIEHLAQGSYFVKVNNQNTSYTLLKK
jgi:hypothetical protein